MAFMELNRFKDLDAGVFDPGLIIEQLRMAFPTVRVLPGDQLALQAQRAEEFGAADLVVRTLRRNQQEYGPAYAFEISADGAQNIRGTARRYDVTFLFDHALSEAWHERLLSFLRTLGAGEVNDTWRATNPAAPSSPAPAR